MNKWSSELLNEWIRMNEELTNFTRRFSMEKGFLIMTESSLCSLPLLDALNGSAWVVIEVAVRVPVLSPFFFFSATIS